MPHPAFDHLFSHFLQADPANFECLTNFTLFENYLKYRIWILAFSPIVCPDKSYLSGNTVWPQTSVFQKIDHFWQFSPNQYVNVSRLIHNVEYRKQLENDYLRPQTYWYTLYNNTMCCNR